MLWLKALSVAALSLGVWQRYKRMGKPIIRGGRRWWRQPDGRYALWHGMGLRREKELPPGMISHMRQMCPNGFKGHSDKGPSGRIAPRVEAVWRLRQLRAHWPSSSNIASQRPGKVIGGNVSGKMLTLVFAMIAVLIAIISTSMSTTGWA